MLYFKDRDKNISSTMRLFSLILVILILLFVLVSSSLVGDHNCTGAHCVICHFTSKITASLATIIFISFVISISISRFVVKTCEANAATLVSLKEKLTS